MKSSVGASNKADSNSSSQKPDEPIGGRRWNLVNIRAGAIAAILAILGAIFSLISFFGSTSAQVALPANTPSRISPTLAASPSSTLVLTAASVKEALLHSSELATIDSSFKESDLQQPDTPSTTCKGKIITDHPTYQATRLFKNDDDTLALFEHIYAYPSKEVARNEFKLESDSLACALQ